MLDSLLGEGFLQLLLLPKEVLVVPCRLLTLATVLLNEILFLEFVGDHQFESSAAAGNLCNGGVNFVASGAWKPQVGLCINNSMNNKLLHTAYCIPRARRREKQNARPGFDWSNGRQL